VRASCRKAGRSRPRGWKVPPVNDLRSAVEMLKTIPGQYIEIASGGVG
jgi:gallate decarboxylase subunit C